jgi:tetratricopeptide (TPR) repeat protein
MAEKCYNKCLKENPNYLNSIINLANLKVILNKYEEAIKLYLKAISINNDVPIFFINLIMAYQSTNQFDKSLELLKECLEKFPNYTKFDKLMSFQTSYNNNHSHFLNMLKKIKQENLKDENKIDLHFALGKAYDDMKIFDQAYENFRKAIIFKRKKMEFNINDKKKLFEDIKSYFFEYNFVNKIKKNYSKNFIFIFGLPRSGTTLTEKIISSHKLVSAAGEINYINNFFGQIFC